MARSFAVSHWLTGGLRRSLSPGFFIWALSKIRNYKRKYSEADHHLQPRAVSDTITSMRTDRSPRGGSRVSTNQVRGKLRVRVVLLRDISSFFFLPSTLFVSASFLSLFTRGWRLHSSIHAWSQSHSFFSLHSLICTFCCLESTDKLITINRPFFFSYQLWSLIYSHDFRKPD